MKMIILLCINLILFTQSYEIKNGEMEFVSVAETVGIETDIIGKGKGLSGVLNLDKKTFRFTYDLWKIDTGIKLRNNHMHENHLETEDYPNATFNGVVLSFENGKIIVEGEFFLHGEKKKIKIEGLIKDNVLIAEWKLNLNDYNIEIPKKFLVAKLRETLDMKITCTLLEKN